MRRATSPPEWRKFNDKTTGVELIQWTSHPAMNHHFYFTNPTVSPDGSLGFFVSYRTGHPNLFSITLSNGEIHQLSARVDINPFSPAAAPSSPWLYASAGNAIHAFHTGSTIDDRQLCQFGDCVLGNCSLSKDGQWLAISCRFSDHCELALVDTQTGEFEILTAAQEIGHIQFSPTNANLLMFSGTPTQRIWLHNRETNETTWVYPQKTGEWIAHESWLSGNEILFPHWPHALRAIKPDGTGLRTIAEINAWHACANSSGTRIVCDTNHPDRGILLIDPASGETTTLCHPDATQRGTQWAFTEPAVGAGIDTSIIRSKTPARDKPPHPDDPASTYGPQWSHPHPTFTPDGGRIIYTSDRDRWSQVYAATINTVRKPTPS